MNNQPFISIDQLALGYQTTCVLKDFSYQFQKAKRYAILGPSGCGKSSLFNAIMGIIFPVQGTIYIQEQEVVLGRPRTGVVLQDFGLLPWKTVRQNILLAANAIPSKDAEKKLNELIVSLELQGLEERYIAQLSGGQKQKVAIARTLLKEKDLLLLDEPFSALDSITKQTLYEIFYHLYLEYQFTLILITHDIEEAALFGEEILVFKGKHPGIFFKTVYNRSPFCLEKGKDVNFYETCREIRCLMSNL
ncbi:MAG TPA: ATP-binding cassette domain-containing protein [Chlamydiales bacterium]|nr:MAG: hypothetical protein A3F67_01345 [Verrucomicrobia bacterium RIFCSPHIGHO2_12_FULL_41_10]HLB52632.1 ATP-binding cassette domain-containing protein [Chlamydiales bacterium]